jgi:hypothetical protein
MSQILFNYSRNRYFGNHSQRGQILCCKRNRKYGASCSVVRNFGDEQFLNSRGCTHTTTAAASACTWPLLPTQSRSVITNPSYLMVALFTTLLRSITLFLFSPGYPYAAYVDEIYATGEGTDAWCSTHQTVPKALYYSYSDPQCGYVHCGILDVISIWIDMISFCNINSANTFPRSYNFICV